MATKTFATRAEAEAYIAAVQAGRESMQDFPGLKPPANVLATGRVAEIRGGSCGDKYRATFVF